MPSFLSRYHLPRLAMLSTVLAMTALPLAGCDSLKPSAARQQELTMYDFSSAMRWGDFDAAYDFVDPKTKVDHPLSDIDRGRLKQVEISGYEVVANVEQPGTIDRQIKLDLINKNTQIPRTVTYHEHWTWDAEHKKWWLTTGLPDVSPQD